MITLWGGHISTTGKTISFNGNAWLTLPEMGTGNGIPVGHQGYNYLQQLNLVIAVPLGHLVSGNNTFQGRNAGQISGPTGYGFDWGQHGWYAIMIRVFYNTSKAHPTATITSPAAGTIIGENPVVTSSVSAGVTRVDYLAYYDGYDTDGDGIYQEYHHDYHIGSSESAMNIKNHVGTTTVSPWQVTWNTQWVPDQVPGSVKLLARVRDNTGTWYVSPEIANLTLQRTGESVKLYKPAPLGERAWARGDLDPVAVNVTIPSADDLSRATSAAYFLRSWNGLDAVREPGETHYRRLNGWDDPTEFGQTHYYSIRCPHCSDVGADDRNQHVHIFLPDRSASRHGDPLARPCTRGTLHHANAGRTVHHRPTRITIRHGRSNGNIQRKRHGFHSAHVSMAEERSEHRKCIGIFLLNSRDDPCRQRVDIPLHRDELVRVRAFFSRNPDRNFCATGIHRQIGRLQQRNPEHISMDLCQPAGRRIDQFHGCGHD